MKKLKLFLLFLIILSCNRNDDHCEKWKVEEWCEPKNSSTYCGGHTTNDLTFCNDDLNNVSVGVVIMWHEDSNAKNYRKFLQKL